MSTPPAYCPTCGGHCIVHLDIQSTPEDPIYLYESRWSSDQEARMRELWGFFDRISNAIWDRNDIHKPDEKKIADVAAIYRDPDLNALRKNYSGTLNKMHRELLAKDKEIAALKEDLAGAEGWPDVNQMREERDEANAKWSEMKQLIPKLLRNLDHLNSCGIWGNGYGRGCTCGMNELREKLTAMGY